MCADNVTGTGRARPSSQPPGFLTRKARRNVAMNSDKRQKYFVTQHEMVTIQCRKCGKTDTFSVSSLRHEKNAATISCQCLEPIDIELETRKDYRRKTNISATFRATTTPKIRARSCTIADQSEGGLLLQITEAVPIKTNDQLIVSFFTDSAALMETERVISVRHYDEGLRIGGAFVDDAQGLAHKSVSSAPH